MFYDLGYSTCAIKWEIKIWIMKKVPKFLISSKINSKFHSVYQACSHNKTWCRWFFIWYSMMATWRLFRPLKTFYFSRNSDQVMSLLFSRSLPRFRRCRPKWSMMTCSMLIMTRVKFLKVANGTRIEKFYDLEPNYSDIEDQIRRQNWTRENVRFEKRHQTNVS